MAAEHIVALGKGSCSPASRPRLQQPCFVPATPPILPVPGCICPEPAGPCSMEPACSWPRQAGPRGRVLLSEAAVPNPGSLGCSRAPVRRLSAPFSFHKTNIQSSGGQRSVLYGDLPRGCCSPYSLRQIPQTSTRRRRNELFPGSDIPLKSTDPDNTRDVCVMKANDTSGNFPPK